MSVHDGHRSRKRNQLISHGLETFADHEVLELLLFYAIPRQDTNVIAHALLEQFGSLEGVFSASAKDLQNVKGVGENAAALIGMILPLFRRLRISSQARPTILLTPEMTGAYFLDLFFGEKEERLYEACLDAKGKLLSCIPIAGGANALNTNTRKLVENALALNASNVILAHNHPSGLAIPSEEDIEATKKVRMALEGIGVALADHLVVADGDFVSMRDSKLL